MTTLEIAPVLTVDDYHKMTEVGIFAPDARLELLEGVIHPMSAIGATHAYIVDLVAETFITLLGTRYRTTIQNPIRLSDTTELQPDVAIVQRVPPGDTPQTPTPPHVYLVVEVSDSTLVRDRTVKMPLYAAATIPELWIVDTTARLIEQYLDPQAGSYQTVKTWRVDETIPTTLGVEIAVATLLL